jgi:PKD repeat protein
MHSLSFTFVRSINITFMKTTGKTAISLFIILVLFSAPLFAQPWTESLPKDENAIKLLTLRDYQKAFNNYWAPYGVHNGYYIENGQKQKAGGWKQFKRWEWFWESRVNPQTGDFPKVSALEQFKKYLTNNRENLSSTGNWTSMGPTSSGGGYAGIGRLNCVAFSPDDSDVIYAGAAAGGIWKSNDGGINWTPIGDDNAELGTSDIVVISGGNNDIIYLATGDRDHSDTYSTGVLKSVDGGTTWNTTGLSWSQSQGTLIRRLIVDPNDDNTLYAATNGGVYKTSNGGTTWNMISGNNFKDMEFKPGSSTIMYGSTGWGEVYRSTNSGNSWTQVLNVSSGRRTELAVCTDDDTRVYVVMANSDNGLHAIYKSTNSGQTFSQVFSGSTTNLLDWACNGSGSGGQGWYDLTIAADPNDADIVFVGGVNTWKSTDAGSSWSIVNHWSGTCGGQATTVHADKHYLAFQNSTSILFECNDGGIYKTTDSGDSWTDLTNTMAISQMYRLGVAQTVDNDVVAGLQDNGTKNYEAGTWDDVISGDGMDCAIDYTDEDTQYGSLYYGDIKRTTNHWWTYTTISNGIGGNGAWVTPYVIDPSNHMTLYVGYNDVWKSTNQGNSWTKISNWNGSTLRSLAVAPSNSQTIYTATYSTLYKTTNGGASWTDITTGLPVGSNNLTYISVKDDDPNTVWISFSGYDDDRVFKSTNGGSSWTNISSGLPELPVNCVIQNKQNISEIELYAGTDVGVYVKIGGDSWTPFFDGLPNVVVNEVEIYYDDVTPSNSRIRAATFGRGLWESDLWSPSPTPEADFEADNLTPTTADTVYFTDLSTNNPTSWLWEITPASFSFINGTDSTSQNPVCIFNQPGFYTISLTATNVTGSDTEIKVDYINVSQAAPDADFEADNLIPSTIDTVQFTDLSLNNPTSWLWEITPNTFDFIDGTSDTSQNPVCIFNEPGFYTVSLTATNTGGSDTETKDDYIDVSQAAPDADFEADNTEPSVGMAVHFTDLSLNDPTSWLWDFDPVTITYLEGTCDTSQNPVVQFDEAGFYTITLTATNSGGSDVETKDNYIEVTYALSVTASADPEEICPGDSSQLNALAAGGTGNYTYSWTSDPAGFTSTLQNPVVTPDETTTYTVEVDDGENTATDDIIVTVNPIPEITLGDWPETLCNQQEPPVQLTATPEGGTYSGSNVTPDGIFTPETAPLGWNVITYTYEDENGCINAATDSIFVDNCVGIINHSEEVINIYPNPSYGNFKITSSEKINSIAIVNPLGKQVLTKSVNAFSVEINTKLNKGTYFVKITLQNGEIISKKIVIR